jgi:hypothetical protein
MEDTTMKKLLSAAVLLAILSSTGLCFGSDASWQDYVAKAKQDAQKNDPGISAAERQQMKDRAAHSPKVSYPTIDHKGTYSQGK